MTVLQSLGFMQFLACKALAFRQDLLVAGPPCS